MKVLLDDDLSNYSLRRQEEIKKVLKVLLAEAKKNYTKPRKDIIKILDNEHMVLYYRLGDYLSEDYLIELEKEIEKKKSTE